MEQGQEKEGGEVFSLGAWDLPSGNRLEIFITGDDTTSMRRLRLRWDRYPPLEEDGIYLLELLRGEIPSRLSEYLEVPPGEAVMNVLWPGEWKDLFFGP